MIRKMGKLSPNELDKDIIKPSFGSPCNGCGYCCSQEICKMGKEIYKTNIPPCSGLKRRGNRFSCYLYEIISEEMRPFLRFRMGIGMGCDSDD